MGYKPLDPAVPQEAHRQGEEVELHAFPAGLLHLRGQSRHEGRGTAIEEVNLLGPGPPGGAGRVHRGVAAADDGHPAAHFRGSPFVDGPQETDAVLHPGQVFAGNLEAEALVGAQGQEDRGEIPAQVFQVDIPAQAGAEPHLRPQLRNHAHLPLQHLPGQAEGGDIEPQGPAQERFSFEEGDRIAEAAQLVGRHEPGGAAPHNGDWLGPVRSRGHVENRVGVQVRQVAFQPGDGNGLVQGVAGAGRLAGMGADAAQDAGEGAALQDHGQGRGQVALLHEAELLPHPDVQGTGGLAGGKLLPDALSHDLVAPVDLRIVFMGHVIGS